MNYHTFIILMSVEDVIRIHDSVINSYGGRLGIHDRGLLESAVNHVWMQLEYGEEENQDIPSLADLLFPHH